MIVTRGLPNFLVCLAAVPLVSACAPASPEKASNAAPTFVSLNPCLDAILVEVAEPEQILSISHYSHQPGGSTIDADTARAFAPNGGTAEEIIALAPDIVLASVFLPPATKTALERAGLRIESFGSPATLDESAAQIERIITLAGHPQRAKPLSVALQTPAANGSTRPFAEGEPGPKPSVLLWQAGQIVAGQETLIAQLLVEAGFKSHAEALGLAQADYVSLEQVLSDPPDLLLVAGDSQGQQHPSLAKLAETRVHYFDPALFYCGGPSVAAAREELAALRRSFDARTP